MFDQHPCRRLPAGLEPKAIAGIDPVGRPIVDPRARVSHVAKEANAPDRTHVQFRLHARIACRPGIVDADRAARDIEDSDLEVAIAVIVDRNRAVDGAARDLQTRFVVPDRLGGDDRQFRYRPRRSRKLHSR